VIKLCGAALPGLDEFTVRFGHLVTVARAGLEAGGGWSRVQKTVANNLTSLISVTDEQNEAVATYLKEKHLCPISSDDEGARDYRYPDLSIIERRAYSKSKTGAVEVWWQDFFLADPSLPSHLGAVTTSAKSGSKTGLSHVMDWANSVGIIASNGEVTSLGRLIDFLGEKPGPMWRTNPYRIQALQIVFAHLLFDLDFDILTRFLTRLRSAKWPIKKREASSAYAKAVNDVIDEADSSRYLTSGQRFNLLSHYKELSRAARSKRIDEGESSTAWHRTVARLEALVDLGILVKSTSKSSHKFSYVYLPSPLFEPLVDSLSKDGEAEGWIENHLVDYLVGANVRSDSMPLEEFKTNLSQMIGALRNPARLYPIELLSVGLSAAHETPISIGACRASLERLGREHPDIARLSRGTSGNRSEYISIDERSLAGHE
jgi:hypothetical protein